MGGEYLSALAPGPVVLFYDAFLLFRVRSKGLTEKLAVVLSTL